MSSLARRAGRRQGETNPDDGGFVLLESIIAISLITVIMSALGVFFVNTVSSATQQRNRTAAIQLANTTVENIRSRDGASLVTGHDLATLTKQFSVGYAPTLGQATTDPVKDWLTSLNYVAAVDPAAATNAGLTAAIPTSPTKVTVGNTDFTTNQYLGYCYIAATGTNNDCVKTSVGTTIRYLRVVVAVSWLGAHCDPLSCTYVTSTLINTGVDPKFLVHQALPAAPVVATVPDQVNAVGDTVNLQVDVQTATGVPAFTWSVTGLPPGLVMSPTGLISGSPTTQTVTPASVTVTVTDAFLRTDTDTFTWTIKPPLAITPPVAQASTTTTAVNLSLAATGGEGAPYTWTDPTASLPPGLSLSSAGTITGTPTTVGQYTVRVTVADKSTTRKASQSFTWTVSYPPLAASNPGTQTRTAGVGIPLPGVQLTANGGSGSYTWADASPRSLPVGLSISASGRVTGTPTVVGTSTVTLTVTDTPAAATKTITFSWVVVAAPTVAAPSNQASSVGSPVSFALTTSCPNAPCTYAFNANAPSGLTISGAGLVTGRITATGGTYSSITVIATDINGATGTSGSFSWLVNPAPKITSPGNQTTLAAGTVSLSMATFASGGTGAYVYTAPALPAWLKINSSTGLISNASSAPANTTTSNITVTLTDSTGASSTTAPFSWKVTNTLAISFGSQTTFKSTAVSLDLDNYTTGGTGPYTYTMTGKPGWLSLNGSTGVLSGTAPSVGVNTTTIASGIVITVRDSTSTFISSSAFTWYVTDMMWTGVAANGSSFSTPHGTSVSGFSGSDFVSGGTTGKVYSATFLPTGVSVASDGTITGTASTSRVAPWDVHLSVTDGAGATITSIIHWTVT